MNTLTGWLRTITAAALIFLLLCVPQTLHADIDVRDEMTWKELESLVGQRDVTVALKEGGAVRGDIVADVDHGIHLQFITMATDRQKYPAGTQVLVPRDEVEELRFETEGFGLRVAGLLAGGFGGGALGAAAAGGSRNWDSAADAILIGWISGTVAGGWLGYKLGKKADLQTHIIMIAD